MRTGRQRTCQWLGSAAQHTSQGSRPGAGPQKRRRQLKIAWGARGHAREGDVAPVLAVGVGVGDVQDGGLGGHGDGIVVGQNHELGHVRRRQASGHVVGGAVALGRPAGVGAVCARQGASAIGCGRARARQSAGLYTSFSFLEATRVLAPGKHSQAAQSTAQATLVPPGGRPLTVALHVDWRLRRHEAAAK